MIDALYYFLEKLGYPHPLHPPFAHVPIGLVTGALVLGLTAWLRRRPALWLAARYCIILALIFLVPTALFGYTDWQHFFGGGWLFYIKVKLILASALLVLLCIAIVVSRHAEGKSMALLTVYFFCFLTVVGLGYCGGQLVFGGWTPKFPAELRVGARLYRGNCSGCHPHGGNIVAPNLPLRLAPQLAEFDTFRAFVRHPTMPNGSPGDMPPFPAARISDPKMQDLYQYINQVLRAPKRE